MEALLFLWKRTFVNRLKKAFRKPVTYLYLFLLVLYGIMIPIGLNEMLSQFHLNTAEGMVVLVTVFCFWMLPSNLIAFAIRKGLLFKKSDVHFLFPTPLSPKMILLFTHAKTLGMSLIMGVLILAAGFFMFHLSPLQMLLFFVADIILENILESSMMVLCYGSEKIGEKQKKYIVALAYALIGCFVVIGIFMYFSYGLNVESIMRFMHSKAVQAVPVVGWYIALMHLIFMGPTAFNLICSLLYLLSVVIFFILAYKMPCTGTYYEDAEKFADDYAELKAKQQEGISAQFGKKEKFGKAKVVYKGGGAKAIFYKQILEYKKTKTFFLDKTNLFFVIIGNVIAYNVAKGADNEAYKMFVMPAVMAYLVICTTAINGKWGKEIKSPYTFLLPDSAIRKLWYATLMEHVKNLVYGLLFAVPCAFMLDIPVMQTVLCVLFYMMLQANKLYSLVMMEALVGSTLGKVGKQFFHMFLQMIPMGLAFTGAVIGVLMASLEAAYLFMSLILLACVAVFMTLAAFSFEKMETA